MENIGTTVGLFVRWGVLSNWAYCPVGPLDASSNGPYSLYSLRTCVLGAFRQHQVDGAVLLRLLRRLARPAAGDDVVGGAARPQPHQVHRHAGELARPAPLQEQHVVVVGDRPATGGGGDAGSAGGRREVDVCIIL